jgi:hypothetical protein
MGATVESITITDTGSWDITENRGGNVLTIKQPLGWVMGEDTFYYGFKVSIKLCLNDDPDAKTAFKKDHIEFKQKIFSLYRIQRITDDVAWRLKDASTGGVSKYVSSKEGMTAYVYWRGGAEKLGDDYENKDLLQFSNEVRWGKDTVEYLDTPGFGPEDLWFNNNKALGGIRTGMQPLPAYAYRSIKQMLHVEVTAKGSDAVTGLAGFRRENVGISDGKKWTAFSGIKKGQGGYDLENNPSTTGDGYIVWKKPSTTWKHS